MTDGAHAQRWKVSPQSAQRTQRKDDGALRARESIRLCDLCVLCG